MPLRRLARRGVIAAGRRRLGNAPGPGETVITTAYITGYTYYDNTPPGSPEISHPILHSLAGGTGTYSDPITVAVGHSIIGGNDILDYPAGTRFYMPFVRRYFMVEDTCGDGPTPQNGPCHDLSTADPGSTTWLDIWIDGRSGTVTQTETCMNNLTGIHTVIKDPRSTYTVVSGPVFQNGACSVQYGETPV